jgi:hypothetical protein
MPRLGDSLVVYLQQIKKKVKAEGSLGCKFICSRIKKKARAEGNSCYA